MRGAVRQHDADALDGVPDLRALDDRLLEALLARGQELWRDVVADARVDELEVGCLRPGRRRLVGVGDGLNVADDARELARAARLLLVEVVELRLRRDRLAEVDARLADLQDTSGGERCGA